MVGDVSPRKSDRGASLQFADGRPQTVAQRALQEAASNSPRVRQLGRIQDLANGRSQSERAASGINNRQPVQRYITDDEGTPLSYSEVWDEIGEAVDGTDDEDRLNFYIAVRDGYSLNSVMRALSEGGAAAPLVPFANEVDRLDVGCSVCVVADFLKITDKQLIKRIFDTEDQESIAMIRAIYMEGGKTGYVEELFKYFNIYLADEHFDNYGAMMESLTSDAEASAWSGALAWEGHVIRASGKGAQCTFWDPQSGNRHPDIPRDKTLIIVTFAAGH